MALHDEIFEQEAVLQHLLDSQMDKVLQVAAAIRQHRVDYVFLAARGTSDYAGTYAQYLLGSLNALPVAFAAPSLFTMYLEPPRLKHALVVGISQSGQSPDVIQVIEEGRRQQAMTLAITNSPDSPLAQSAEFALDIHAGHEKAVAATKTFTAELLTLAILSAALKPDPPQRLDALAQVPAVAAEMLKLEARLEELAGRFRAIEKCVVLGRGYHYATALEWSLKMKELDYVLAHPFSPADFQHGPIAVLEPGFPVFAIAPSGATYDSFLPLLKQMRGDYGAELLVLSDGEEALAAAQNGVRLPGELPEWLLPVVSIIPVQLFCYHLAKAKGYDTEQPRNIRKVTLTR